MLDQQFFSIEEYRLFLQENFVLYKAHGTNEAEMRATYQIPGFPAVVVANPAGVEIGRLLGYNQNSESYLDAIKEILDDRSGSIGFSNPH